MICERCKKNNASFFLEENINGKKRSMALCSHCAEEMKNNGELKGGDTFYNSFGISSPLYDSLFGSLFSSGIKSPQIGEKKSCPHCGFTLDDFRRSGKAGCSVCYQTFEKELEGTIRSIHGNAKHVGRAPKKFRQNKEKIDQLNSLKEQLKTAIEKEDFENAATLRDQIRSLESGK